MRSSRRYRRSNVNRPSHPSCVQQKGTPHLNAQRHAPNCTTPGGRLVNRTSEHDVRRSLAATRSTEVLPACPTQIPEARPRSSHRPQRVLRCFSADNKLCAKPSYVISPISAPFTVLRHLSSTRKATSEMTELPLPHIHVAAIYKTVNSHVTKAKKDNDVRACVVSSRQELTQPHTRPCRASDSDKNNVSTQSGHYFASVYYLECSRLRTVPASGQTIEAMHHSRKSSEL